MEKWIERELEISKTRFVNGGWQAGGVRWMIYQVAEAFGGTSALAPQLAEAALLELQNTTLLLGSEHYAEYWANNHRLLALKRVTQGFIE